MKLTPHLCLLLAGLALPLTAGQPKATSPDVAKLDPAEIAANRRGGSTDAKADAAVHFAVAVTEQRGRVDSASLEAVKAAGYSEAELLEIIGAVALNVLTNSVNNVAQTDVDFPAVSATA